MELIFYFFATAVISGYAIGVAEYVTDVLTTFWRLLWSITEQAHGNMESICFI